MVKRLYVFKGYTVDFRLKQFRKINSEQNIIFIEFSSEEGERLLSNLINSLNLNKLNDKQIFKRIMNLF